MPEFVLDFERPIVEIEQRIAQLREFSVSGDIEITKEIERLEARARKLRLDVYSKLTRWQRVQLARHPKRPYALDYINRMFTDFIELHGDRHFGDDKAIVGGLAKFDGKNIAVLGQQKGRDTKENLIRNFGSAHPEGYRKAIRIMKLAEKFNLSVIIFSVPMRGKSMIKTITPAMIPVIMAARAP